MNSPWHQAHHLRQGKKRKFMFISKTKAPPDDVLIRRRFRRFAAQQELT